MDEGDFLRAVRLGNVDNVINIMQENKLIRNDVCGALHYAAFYGQVEMVRHFITAYKCPVDFRDNIAF